MQSTKLIFVGDGQLNSTSVLVIFAPGMYDNSFLNMQHLGEGHIFFLSDSSFYEIPATCSREIPATLYARGITTDILE